MLKGLADSRNSRIFANRKELENENTGRAA
jgi:hypothetical protein